MPILRILVAIAVCASQYVSQAQAEPVLTGPDNITVTDEDIQRYIVENVPADKKTAVLARAHIFKEMAETLYVIRTVMAEAESSPGFDKEQAAWAARMSYERGVVSRYRTAYVRRELADVDWEAAAKEQYQAEPEQYMAPERVRASHILISPESRSDEEAHTLASEIRDRLIAGEDFVALAKEFTDDPAGRKNGGDLGFFASGKMVPSFDKVAFAMQKSGEISDVVKSPFGYHIILFVERKPAEKIPFDKVKGSIIDGLQKTIGGRIWQDKIIAIRSSREIKLNQELLDKMKSEYQPAAPSD